MQTNVLVYHHLRPVKEKTIMKSEEQDWYLKI